jgi:hypothetical protein
LSSVGRLGSIGHRDSDLIGLGLGKCPDLNGVMLRLLQLRYEDAHKEIHGLCIVNQQQHLAPEARETFHRLDDNLAELLRTCGLSLVFAPDLAWYIMGARDYKWPLTKLRDGMKVNGLINCSPPNCTYVGEVIRLFPKIGVLGVELARLLEACGRAGGVVADHRLDLELREAPRALAQRRRVLIASIHQQLADLQKEVTLLSEVHFEPGSAPDQATRQDFDNKVARHGPNDVSVTAAYADTDLTGNGLQEQRFLERDYASVYTKPDNTQNRSGLVSLAVRCRSAANAAG